MFMGVDRFFAQWMTYTKRKILIYNQSLKYWILPLARLKLGLLAKKINFGTVLVCGPDLREKFSTKKQVIGYQYTVCIWMGSGR